MKKIFKHLLPHRKKLILVALMHVVATLSSLLLPYVMSFIVDSGIREKNTNAIITSAILMLLLAGLSLITALISNRINASVVTAFSSSVCKTMFKKINSLSFEQYSSVGSSGLLTRSTDDIFNIEGAASELVYTLVTVPIMLVGGSVLSFLSDPVLSLIFVLAIPPVLIFIGFLVKPLYNMWELSDKYIDEQNKIVRERLSGLRVIRAFNNEKKEHGRAKFATEEMAKYIIKSNVRSGFITPVALFILNIATVAMLWAGASRAGMGIISEAGSVIATIQYVTLITNAVLMLSWTIAWIPHLKVSINRIEEILSMPETDEGADDIIEGRFKGEMGVELDLKQISFRYPDSKNITLKNISLKVNKGESVAIIGGTGCGKSTLVRLLLSFYTPTEGEIFINGNAYSQLKKTEIRSAFSVALQKGMIFEGTLRDNVRMGKKEASDEEINEVLSACMMGDFVASQDEGLSYGLVGMGQNVSGGQRQRISIARTVIREAPVYIFDDSFSALDYYTEKEIRKNLTERLYGKTKIFVTQRVSTAITCKNIFVMDKGEIVASGTHSELLKSSLIYREICISQLGEKCVKGGVE